MKASELRDLSPEELQQKQQELIEELFNLRFQLATGQIENVGRISRCAARHCPCKNSAARASTAVHPIRAHKVAGYGRGSKKGVARRSSEQSDAQDDHGARSSAVCVIRCMSGWSSAARNFMRMMNTISVRSGISCVLSKHDR